ncbi:MAG: hypothetical protein IPN55_12125 [Saprospiraceae bacterium]|nr:hypothetical protein [Candidatus Brachybacter algidus]
MIGRLKKMLGIDGLKVEIIASDIYDADKEYIDGELILLSKYQLVIESIEVRVIEKYTRGRFRTKKTDEYDIGSIKTGFSLPMTTNKLITVPFKIPVDYLMSSMDKFGSKNFLFKGLAKGAKMLKGVKSQYRLEVEVKIQGSAINTFTKQDVTIV